MKRFLHSQGLLGYIDGTHSCPPSHITINDTTTFQPNPAHSLRI